MSYEARILRDRHEATVDADGRAARFAEDGSVALLVQTKAVALYPSSANAFFACSPVRIDGLETEGGAATFIADPTRTFFVYNLGSRVPPVGAKLIAQSCAGRWTFRFEG